MRDALVFIGRFQPFHNGHKAVIEAALEQAKEVVVVVGSSFAARNIRNPFTFEERKAMIEACFDEPQHFNYSGAQGRNKTPRIHVVPVSDFPYDDNKWIAAIMRVVKDAVPSAVDVGLIGHSKDSSSYYLEIFPKWKNHVEVPNVGNVNATDIRTMMFDGSVIDNGERIKSVMPNRSYNRMAGFIMHNSRTNGPWDVLSQEYQMVTKYKAAWKSAPFPPTFMTVDAVVVQSGHILLVERGDMPGKGLWALPGGFLNQAETMLDGALRELKEETKIKVPVPVLRGSVVSSKTFDAPNRSSRGRTITQAFHIDLGVGDLPKVKGSDDAAKAFWVPFNEVKQELLFEDHFHIIDNFINIG